MESIAIQNFTSTFSSAASSISANKSIVGVGATELISFTVEATPVVHNADEPFPSLPLSLL